MTEGNKREQNLHRPKIPKIPDEQSAGFKHRAKIPKNPKILRNYQARPWQSSKKSWDSWESLACAWILHFVHVHQESWESWACADLVSFLHLWNHKTCTGPRFPRIPMNKVQDPCTGPRFPRIPRFWGTIKQDPGKVPFNLGILGNLGPVHESCALFIRILGVLGPVQIWWAFSIFEVTKPAQAQDSQDSWWTKCRIHAQAQDSQESQDFWELSSKTLAKFQKILWFLGILGLRMNPALCSCSSGILGILGLCRFGEQFLHLWNHKTCTGPRFPRLLMNKVQDSCTGPRFPRIPRFLGSIKQDPGKVPKNLGILGNLGPVHESCTLFIGILGNLGPVQVWWAFSIFEITKPAQAQDSQESGAGSMHRPKIPLEFLGILGLCMNPALCSSGFLGILGLCRFYEGLMWHFVVYSKKCISPVFFDGEHQNSCRGSSFSGRISENGELDYGFAFFRVF